MRATRGSETFMRADLVGILRALLLATKAARGSAEYEAGYAAAIATVAVALSIAWYEIESEHR